LPFWNKVLHGEELPEDWEKSMVLALFFEGVVKDCNS
jgi:hypothetical protein